MSAINLDMILGCTVHMKSTKLILKLIKLLG